MMTGYRFRVTKFEVTGTASRVTLTNVGIAPPYHDAFVSVNGVRATKSLRGLLPSESRTFKIASGGATPKLSIESDRLVQGQQIPFEADLN